jgi:outer membrane protein
MKKPLLFVVMLLLSILIYVPSLTAKEIKLGVFDIQKIVRESKSAKSAMAILMKDVEAKRAMILEKQNELRNLEADLKKASSADRKAKQEKLAEAAKEYKRLVADLDEEHKKKTAELNQMIIKEIREVVTNVSTREAYTLVMEKGTVYYSNDEFDITDKIIKEYDQRK